MSDSSADNHNTTSGISGLDHNLSSGKAVNYTCNFVWKITQNTLMNPYTFISVSIQEVIV